MIDSIKDYVLTDILIYKPDYDSKEIYDEDGHCGDRLYAEILNFWEGFDSKSLIYLVTGNWASDDLDLNGGRSYLLSDEKLINMLATYIIDVLKWSVPQYYDKVTNSETLTEDISNEMSNILLKRKEIKVEEKKDVNIWESFDFNKTNEEKSEDKVEMDFIPKVIKYDFSMKDDLKKYKQLKFISIVSDGLLYEIVECGVFIPKGYKVL